MSVHQQLGNRGESIACTHLLKNGYQILEQNWRYDRAEIDIIAELPDFLVVIEVKTRTTDFFGLPSSFVSERQQDLLIKAAEAYIIEKDIDKEVRFDIIGIVLDPALPHQTRIQHIADAFSAFG